MYVIILIYSLLYRIYNITICMYICMQLLFNIYFITIVNRKIICVKD